MSATRTPQGLVFILCGAGGLLALIYNQSLFHGVSDSDDRAGRMAVHEAALTMGVVLGAAAGGMLYQYFSMPVLFQVYAGFLALSAALQAAYGLLMRGKRT
jgi:predicted MFS family arabinose efflux permease